MERSWTIRYRWRQFSIACWRRCVTCSLVVATTHLCTWWLVARCRRWPNCERRPSLSTDSPPARRLAPSISFSESRSPIAPRRFQTAHVSPKTFATNLRHSIRYWIVSTRWCSENQRWKGGNQIPAYWTHTQLTNSYPTDFRRPLSPKHFLRIYVIRSGI